MKGELDPWMHTTKGCRMAQKLGFFFVMFLSYSDTYIENKPKPICFPGSRFLVQARTWPAARLAWKHPMLSELGNAADSSWTSPWSWHHQSAQSPHPEAGTGLQTPDEREGSWLYCCCWAPGKELGRGKCSGLDKKSLKGMDDLTCPHTHAQMYKYI